MAALCNCTVDMSELLLTHKHDMEYCDSREMSRYNAKIILKLHWNLDKK